MAAANSKTKAKKISAPIFQVAGKVPAAAVQAEIAENVGTTDSGSNTSDFLAFLGNTAIFKISGPAAEPDSE